MVLVIHCHFLPFSSLLVLLVSFCSLFSFLFVLLGLDSLSPFIYSVLHYVSHFHVSFLLFDYPFAHLGIESLLKCLLCVMLMHMLSSLSTCVSFPFFLPSLSNISIHLSLLLSSLFDGIPFPLFGSLFHQITHFFSSTATSLLCSFISC